MRSYLYLLLLVLVTGYGYSQTLYFPPISGITWETTSPQSLGWCTDKLDDLKNYLKEKNSKAFIILKDGKIVVEWYFDSFTKDSIWYWASANKSLTSFLIGKAQEEGYLKITDQTSKYLGKGWTSLDSSKENLITIKHQLTMTTGLDDGVSDPDCTLKGCLEYKADAGSRWAYHNAPYTLLGDVIEKAVNTTRNEYSRSRVANKIGMTGLWLNVDYNDVYYSTARSMARYGLLIYNKAVWDKDTLLYDRNYFDQMINTSQNLNKSYGYLWWLNGKGSYMLPGMQLVFKRDLIPEAPSDLFAALGKNDQKIYIVKSLGLIVVRMGNASGTSMLALSSFDNEVWAKISDLKCNSTEISKINIIPKKFMLYQNYPNPFNPTTKINFDIPESGYASLKVYDALGQEVSVLAEGFFNIGRYGTIFDASRFSSGLYYYKLITKSFSEMRKMIFEK